MTLTEQLITIGVVALATQLTRWVPFLLIKRKGASSEYVRYIGKVLPSVIFAMLVVYCYRNVDFVGEGHGLKEIVAGLAVVVLQVVTKNMAVAMVGGTVLYVVLVN